MHIKSLFINAENPPYGAVWRRAAVAVIILTTSNDACDFSDFNTGCATHRARIDIREKLCPCSPLRQNSIVG